MKRIDSLVPFTALEELDQMAAAYWERLHAPDFVGKASELIDSVPAFLVRGEQPLVYVCFPTYRVDIPFPEDDSTYDQKLEVLLQNVSYRSRLRADALDCAIVRNRYIQLPAPPRCGTIVCLGKNLQENAKIRDKLITILEQEHFLYTVFPVYQHKVLRIKFMEDGDSFVVLH